MTEDKKILVTYASVSGSTGEVAQAIGQVLNNQAGLAADVRPMQMVDDVAAYDAIIAGSSIRAGMWLPEAMHFVEQHQAALSHKQVAYFTTCLTMVDDSEDSRRAVLAYMEPILQKTPKVKPLALGLFAGSLDAGRQLMMPVPGPQGDYRDWQAIRGWAAEVASALLEEAGDEAKEEATSTIVLRNAALAYTDMSGADLHAVDLTRADLYQARLSQSDLHQATLNWAEMNWSDMSGADLSRANLIGAHLKHANLEQANLSYAILNGADLSFANLSGADLSFADLNWADFQHANLSRANLSGARLGWANLSQVDLQGVDLSQAKYNLETQWPEGFSASEQGAILVSGLH